MSGEPQLRVEVWSDVVCPWCYIGKRRLERALARFPYADQVEVRWRSFQLDPAYPRDLEQPVYDYLARKYGGSPAQVRSMTGRVAALAAEEGLAYEPDRALVVNTFDAHRLVHLAGTRGLDGELHQRLMRAHFAEGESLRDQDTLARLGAEVGLPAESARELLAGDEYARDVEEDGREASRLGATGVPFFVLDRRYGIAGAQPVETFLSTLHSAYDRAASAAP